MGAINLVCWGLGIALIAVGYARARGPWARYQQIKAQVSGLVAIAGFVLVFVGFAIH